MNIVEMILTAFALSMDAFAVSICRGLCLKKPDLKTMFTFGLYFGVFQGLMPVIGYFLGVRFESYITAIDHWIAFILLAIIGGKMIYESFEKKCDDDCDVNLDLSPKTMLPMAIATSIDALAVGVTFAFLNVNIVSSASLIATITFVVSAFGIKIGHVVGSKFKSRAEFAGGAILVLIGLKILLEHLGIF